MEWRGGNDGDLAELRGVGGRWCVEASTLCKSKGERVGS